MKINMNTLKYEAESIDGEFLPYAANITSGEIFSRVDPNGRQHVIIVEIVDYAQDSRCC